MRIIIVIYIFMILNLGSLNIARAYQSSVRGGDHFIIRWPQSWQLTRIPMARLGGDYLTGAIESQEVTVFVKSEKPEELPTKRAVKRLWEASSLNPKVLSSKCTKKASLFYECKRISKTNDGRSFDIEQMLWFGKRELIFIKGSHLTSEKVARALLTDLVVERK